ncbi:MAG: EamA family transporter [Thermoleophilia bacterium]|nr:EamA family transporter [Thermoleophilia bacterium]
MPASALVFALAAAFLHAFWNLLIARARDPEAATAVAFLVALVAYAPVAAATWRVEARAWPYVAASGLLHLGYAALLAAAYRRAELSVVYPVSRGTAPVLVLVVGAVALGAGTSAGQALGVLSVAVGVVLVRGARRAGGASARTGILFGLTIAGVIAAYTLNDHEGVSHAAPFAYLEVSMLVAGLGYAGALAALRGPQALRAELRPPTVAAGLATFASYGLVLAALQRAPAASVAAVRETSIVIASALAAFVLREAVAPLRLLGAVLVAAGVALISAG